jgi:hypothetical protein
MKLTIRIYRLLKIMFISLLRVRGIGGVSFFPIIRKLMFIRVSLLRLNSFLVINSINNRIRRKLLMLSKTNIIGIVTNFHLIVKIRNLILRQNMIKENHRINEILLMIFIHMIKIL